MLKGRHIDWLLHVLVTKVNNYCLHQQHCKASGFKNNLVLEDQARSTVQNAKAICCPENRVQLPTSADAAALIKNKGKVHRVQFPGTETASYS